MRTTTALTLALLAAACTPPEELVDDGDTGEGLTLTTALPALFKDFEQGADRLTEITDAIEAGVVSQGVDLAGDKDQRVFSIDPLTFDGLDVTHPSERDPEEQTPVVAFGRSRHDFATNLDTALEKNQVCIESDSTVWYGRTYIPDDETAFRGGTADVLRSLNEVRKELSFIAAGWYDLHKDFRRFELVDGRQVLAARSWAEKVYFGDNGTNEFAQTFVAELWIEDAGEVTRVYAIWPEIKIGLGPDAMRTLVGDSLLEGFERADNFGDDAGFDYCREPRDREYDRPQE